MVLPKQQQYWSSHSLQRVSSNADTCAVSSLHLSVTTPQLYLLVLNRLGLTSEQRIPVFRLGFQRKEEPKH